MATIIKKVKRNDKCNNLEFYTTDLLRDGQIVVRDNDALMERLYTVGRMQEITMGEDLEKIESVDQVIKAWESGQVWF